MLTITPIDRAIAILVSIDWIFDTITISRHRTHIEKLTFAKLLRHSLREEPSTFPFTLFAIGILSAFIVYIFNNLFRQPFGGAVGQKRRLEIGDRLWNEPKIASDNHLILRALTKQVGDSSGARQTANEEHQHEPMPSFHVAQLSYHNKRTIIFPSDGGVSRRGGEKLKKLCPSSWLKAPATAHKHAIMWQKGRCRRLATVQQHRERKKKKKPWCAVFEAIC